MQKASYNTRQIKGEGYRLHTDGRDDHVQGANVWRILKEASREEGENQEWMRSGQIQK